MIVLFTGRRPSGPGGPFPDAAVPWLAERLDLLLAGLRPRLVVGSAAAGTDLLAVTAALRAGAQVDLLLTEDTDAFVMASVADKGPAWVRAFQDLSRRPGVRLLPVAGAAADDDGFRTVNRALLDHARTRLHEPHPGRDPQELVVVAVTGGRREGEDHTESLAEAAERLGHLVLRLDPAAERETTPTAVAEPPREADASDGPDTADDTWHRILVPALLATGYRPIRTDIEAGAAAALIVTGLVQPPGPQATGAPGTMPATLLLAPHWATSPTGRRPAEGIGDRPAVEAIRTLRPTLEASRRASDGPAWTVLPLLDPVRLPADRDNALVLRLAHRADEVSRAAGAGRALDSVADARRLLAIAAGVRREELPEGGRHALLEQIGLALVSLGRLEEGRDVLAPLAQADPAYARVRLQQSYALTLVHRPGEPRERLPYLREAERRLRRLDTLHPGSSETRGLLGSAAKQVFDLTLRLGGTNARRHLDRAVDAYRSGTAADPGDHYPGINALALLRLRGQRFGGGPGDVTEAESLLPVVRGAVEHRPLGPDDTWEHATLAELALHRCLLAGRTSAPPAEAEHHYALAARSAKDSEISSMRRQLELFLASGDPSAVVAPLLATVGEPLEGRDEGVPTTP